MSKPSRALRPDLHPLESRLLLSRAKPAVDTNLTFGGDDSPGGARASRLADTATVEVVRPTGRGQVQVQITTPTLPVDSAGVAQPGVDFQPIDQVVTFPPGQTSQTVQIPLIHPSPHAGPLDLLVSGTILGAAPASYQGFSGGIKLIDRTDVIGPKVIASQLIQSKGVATGVSLTFDEPLDPASVPQSGSYRAIVGVSKPNRPTRSTVLRSDVSLDPAGTTLTLTFRNRLRLAANQVVAVNSFLSGLTTYDVMLADAAGNPIQDINLQFSAARPNGRPIPEPRT